MCTVLKNQIKTALQTGSYRFKNNVKSPFHKERDTSLISSILSLFLYTFQTIAELCKGKKKEKRREKAKAEKYDAKLILMKLF